MKLVGKLYFLAAAGGGILTGAGIFTGSFGIDFAPSVVRTRFWLTYGILPPPQSLKLLH
jgi:hypothetical protein